LPFRLILCFGLRHETIKPGPSLLVSLFPA
jgi:hypothetical protein